MDSGKVVLGALAGIAAGAVLGILFAPDSGVNTRKKITKTGDDFVDKTGVKFNELLDTMTQKFEALKSEATEMVENGKGHAHDAFAEVNKAVQTKKFGA